MTTFNLVLIVLAAFVNLVTAYFVLELRKVVAAAADNILKVELATNSMKDALVEATARANLSEGREQGRDKAEERVQNNPPPTKPLSKEPPLPVADERTAKAAEKTADAAKETAAATGRIADATEKSTKKP